MKRQCLSTLAAAAFAAFLIASASAEDKFTWFNLVSDIHGVTHHTDAHLVNPWGIVPGPGNTWWVANNGTGTATVYRADGTPVPLRSPLVVTIPPGASSGQTTSAPTGIELNHRALVAAGANDFRITKGTVSQPAVYLFCTQDGVIAGYNYLVDPANAVIAVDNSASGAKYTGLALAREDSIHHRLYAANFHSGSVEVYGPGFALDAMATGKINTGDLNPVAGFAPFNVKHVAVTDPFTNRVARYVAVAYAKRNPTTEDEVAGAGLGYVNVFKPDGTFVKRLVQYNPDPAHPNELNAPWGMATAHGKFGDRARYLLVGNFGDGTIHRFSLRDLSGRPLGALKDGAGNDLAFDGLWGLHFGRRPNAPGHDDDDSDDVNENSVALYFAAGIADEGHGLFGRIIAR